MIDFTKPTTLKEMPVYPLPVHVDVSPYAWEHCPYCIHVELKLRATHLVPSTTTEGYFLEYHLEGYLYCPRCGYIPCKPAMPTGVLVVVKPKSHRKTAESKGKV